MRLSVVNGGYEEYMRRLAEEADKGMMEILGYIPNGRASDRLEYMFAVFRQRDERARRRYEISMRGNCAVLKPAAFKRGQAAA
jgi:hypothetical protein